MTMQRTGLKVGDVAARLGATPRTLRFYEDEGLLVAHRSAGGTRYYQERDVARLKAILDLARIGIPIEQIQGLALERAPYRRGARAGKAVTAMLADLEAECTARLDDLRRTLEDLPLVRRLVAECRACRRQPDSRHCPDCPVRLARNHSALANLIWDQDD